MAGVGIQIAKRLGILVIGNIIVWSAVSIIDNKIHGKTWNGKQIGQKEKTYVDWQGHIVLGSNDGWVV